MRRQLIVLIAIIGLSASALAQDRTVERRAKGPSGANIRIGMYINVRPDCTSGPLPTIRLVGAPENGKVKVKRVKVRATNYRQCLALNVPGYIAFYRSRSLLLNCGLALRLARYARVVFSVGAIVTA